MARRLFTSESVTEGHPDKIADQISDSILDAMLKEDPRSRVAVETLITTGQVHVAGEVTTTGWVDIPTLVRETILEIGYDSSKKGFDGASCGVSVSIGSQSPDIAQGVDDALEERDGEAVDELDRQGAGDQGLMFGYACDDTPELMPLPIHLAHNLARRLAEVRKDGAIPYLRPDGKTQVTIEYDENDKAVRLDTIVVSTQHAADIDLETLLTPDIEELVVRPEIAGLDIETADFRLLVNPTGRFEIGGPMGDAGLTGRKIIVDTYGGMARHGGGAFSGKDPSKVDRSAAYAMRWVAKNVVAAGPRPSLRGPGRLRHRQGAPGRRVRRDLRHRRPSRRRHPVRGARDVRPAPGRDHPRPRPAAPDLRADRGLRPLRPRACPTSPGSAPTAPRRCAPRPACRTASPRSRTAPTPPGRPHDSTRAADAPAVVAGLARQRPRAVRRDERRPRGHAVVPVDDDRASSPTPSSTASAAHHDEHGFTAWARRGARLRARCGAVRRLRRAGHPDLRPALLAHGAVRRDRLAARATGGGWASPPRRGGRARGSRSSTAGLAEVVSFTVPPNLALAGRHAATRHALLRRLPPPARGGRRLVGTARPLPQHRGRPPRADGPVR